MKVTCELNINIPEHQKPYGIDNLIKWIIICGAEEHFCEATDIHIIDVQES